MLTLEMKAGSRPWGHIAVGVAADVLAGEEVWHGEKYGGIDLGGKDCAIEGDKRWTMRAAGCGCRRGEKVRASNAQREGSGVEWQQTNPAFGPPFLVGLG